MNDPNQPDVPQAQPPAEFSGVRTTAPKKAAVGAASVFAAMKQVWREMGISRGLRGLLALNQPGGIDCMSCAWADPDEGRGIVEFCENGAKALAWEGDLDRAGPEFFAAHSVAELVATVGLLARPAGPADPAHGASPRRHALSTDRLGRGIRPDRRRALRLASPDEAIFYTSGRTSNEAAFLYQLFVRQFGTNNLPDCSNMCHESSGARSRRRSASARGPSSSATSIGRKSS